MPGSIAPWHLPWDPYLEGHRDSVVAKAGKAVGFLSPFPSLPQLDSCMAYNMLYIRCSKPVGCNPSGKPISRKYLHYDLLQKQIVLGGVTHDETVLKCHSNRKADVASYIQDSMKAT